MRTNQLNPEGAGIFGCLPHLGFRAKDKQEMPRRHTIAKTRLLLLAGVVGAGVLVFQAKAQTALPAASSKGSGATREHYQPDRFAGRAGKYYQLIWGVDSLSLKYTESGEVIRFSYRILDAQKAKVLNDKKNEPSLIDPKAGVKLVVPMLEKVGQLRQSSTPEPGKSYWMAFSNKGRLVKKGDRVDIVIGQFRAQGLVVD